MNVDATQLAMLAGEATLVTVLLLGLFRLRSRLGLSPLFVALGVLQPIQVHLSASLYVELLPNLLVSPGSIVLFSASLLAVLLVYIREDATAVRKVIYALVTANLVVSLLYVVFGAHLRLPSTQNPLGMPAELYDVGARVMAAGTFALVLDVLLVIVVYEALGRWLRRALFVRAFLALAVTLTADSLVFTTGAFLGEPMFLDVLLSGLIGKALAAVFFAAALALYLRHVEPDEQTAGEVPIRDVFHALTYREKYELHRIEARATLGRELARREAILEATTDGILSVDADGRIEEVNAACEKTLGERREVLIGQQVEAVILSPSLCDRLRRGAAFLGPLEVRGRRPNGTFPAELVAVRTEENGSASFTISLRDISESKRLQEEQLQSNKMEAIGQLAGGVAHDFNNLLTIILGATEMLKDGGQEAAMIRDAAERASDLTSQLLLFARKQVLTPKVVDLNERVRNLEGMCARLVGEGIELELALEDGLLPVLVSPGLLDQVVLNLVANARDAMVEGGRLCIATRTVRDEDQTTPDSVTLAVSDTGPGMNEEVMRHVFDPYFTTKDPGKGTGLGLSMCAGFVEQSGGRISARSEVGKGSTFTVTLPRSERRPDELQDGDRPSSEGSPSCHVLVVDDEPQVLELTSNVLSAAGYRVRSAGGGESAIRIARRLERLDLLVTDFVMPGMRGDELAERILELQPRARVLFLSGHARVGPGQGVETLPGPLLCKPFSPRRLLESARAALEGIGVGEIFEPGDGSR